MLGHSKTSATTVTVIMAVYNAESYLSHSIESVLNQTFSDFKLLLIDDGSSDRSLEILNEFVTRDKRCHVFTGENCGVVAARNRGLVESKGEFIAIMDADDICRPHRLEKQVAYMCNHPNCVVVGSRVLFIDSDGLPLCEMLDVFSHNEIENALFETRLGIVHPSCMLRASALKVVGGYNSSYPQAQDLDLFLRLGEIGCLANLQDVLLEYRQHSASISYDCMEQQALLAKDIVKTACKRRGLDWSLLEVAIPKLKKSPPRSDIYKKWGWWALGGGNVRSARKHALNALMREPMSPNIWRLCACALRGH